MNVFFIIFFSFIFVPYCLFAIVDMVPGPIDSLNKLFRTCDHRFKPMPYDVAIYCERCGKTREI